MNDQLQPIAVIEAQHLLEHFRVEHPDWQNDRTPLDTLVNWYGLHIATFHPDDYPEGTYGYLEPNEKLIWLCRNLSETLRRFTLAHELGHAVLHHNDDHALLHMPHLHYLLASPDVSRDDRCQQPDVQEELLGPHNSDYMEDILGIGQSYDPRSQRELAANLFAAELLMPLERVHDLYFNQRIAASDLAKTFEVSHAAMLNRLAGLLTEAEQLSDNSSQPSPLEKKKPSSKKQYDEFQQAAIEAPTPALIVAGPGSGKTSTLIGRTQYLIEHLNVPPQHILALTFSRKAAQEMQERLEQVLDEGTSLPTVSTFHAFCADLLRTYGGLVGLRPDFSLLDEADGYFLLRQCARDMRLQHYRNLRSPAFYFPDMLKAISRAKDELVTPEQYAQLALAMLNSAQGDEEAVQKAEKSLEVAHVYALYEMKLQQRQDTDFGGLLVSAVQLLERYPEIREEQHQRYQHILVDEFQDINRVSGVLLRLLAGEQQRIWVVGDANQAIYGFRGASPANISQFQHDYRGAAVLPLSRNYRSRPDIVHIAESFRCKQLELGEEVTTEKNVASRLTESDAYITLAEAADAASELNGIIADIHRKHRQGYSYQDMVILCRTRSLAKKITRALAQAGLPIVEQSSMLEQEYTKDALAIILLIADSRGMGLLRAARQPDHALSQSDIEAILLVAKAAEMLPMPFLMRNEILPNMSREGRYALAHLVTILRSLHQHATNMWSLLAQYLLIETSLIRNLLTEPANKSNRTRLSDYAALLQMARRYDQQQYLLRTQQQEGKQNAQPDIPSLQEQARGFLEYLNVMITLRQDGGNRGKESEQPDEASRDVIRVMTVHASKGLEFPVVYLPNLLQQRFPLRAHSSPISAPIGMLPAESEGKIAHESGEACLFYVGVTRARDHLILSYSERYGKQRAKPSPYLDTIIAGLPDDRLGRMYCQNGSGNGNEEEMTGTTGTIGTLSPSQPGEHFIEAMKPTTLDASALETYQRCPRQYLYGNIYQFRSEEGTYQLFWRAMQKTQDALQERFSTSSATIPTQQEAQELYTQHWHGLEGHTFPFAAIYEQHGHEAIELLRRKMISSRDTNWELRQNFTVEIGQKTVHFRVDRVEASQQDSNKPMKFVRTQFGKSKEKPAAGTRELLYARAYRQQHPNTNLELHCHNLSTGETFPITLSSKKEQALYDELEQSILALERNEYPPIPDAFLCPQCPFFLICPS